MVKRTSLAIFLVVVQLIHRLTQSDISCTTTARLFFFPQLEDEKCEVKKGERLTLTWYDARGHIEQVPCDVGLYEACLAVASLELQCA